MKQYICRMCGEFFQPQNPPLADHVCEDCSNYHPESLILIIAGCMLGTITFVLAWLVF